MLRRFRFRRQRQPDHDRLEAFLWTLGCAACSHNKLPGEADPDACDLGSDWDEVRGCPHWKPLRVG
jgi:hypothetical protein